MMDPQGTSSSTSTVIESSNESNYQQPLDQSFLSSSNDDVNDSLLSINFNQDGGCLAVGTTNGFRICNVFPFEETFRRKFLQRYQENLASSESAAGGGGIGHIEMLFRCNLLAIVGGGPSPHYPPNKVMIWDDHLGRPIGELSFRQKVLNVKLRRDRICVALTDRIYVYNFGNLSLLDTIAVGGEKNGLGLLCISTDTRYGSSMNDGKTSNHCGMVLACPSVVVGQVRVELYGSRKTVFIDAHESSLAAMAMSVDGSLLVTASEKGTLIRLFETGWKSNQFGSMKDAACSFVPSGQPLREFRRGLEPARISSLVISMDRLWMACTSDRGTAHIFRLHIDENKEDFDSLVSDRGQSSDVLGPLKDGTTSSRFVKAFLPNVFAKSTKKLLLEGEGSCAQIRGIPYPKACTFVPDHSNMIAVAGLDDYGNGCMILSSFGNISNNDKDVDSVNASNKFGTRKVGYHRFFKKNLGKKLRHKGFPGTLQDDRRDASGQGLIVQDVDDDRLKSIVEMQETDLDGFVNIESYDRLWQSACSADT